MIEILVDKYPKEECLYFSWDAASWHASKMFETKVKEINERKYKEGILCKIGSAAYKCAIFKHY